MPKTIRNKYEENLTYEKLMLAHNESKKGKGYRREIIKFNLKFYVTEPKVRKIEKSRYIDRIVHRWVVDNFLEPAYIPQFIKTTYACIKNV